jgi:DnaJ-class molecular chaperone
MDRKEELEKLENKIDDILYESCQQCDGTGQVIIGENKISRDMATDAGAPQLEGQFHSYVYGVCPVCDGSGRIKK